MIKQMIQVLADTLTDNPVEVTLREGEKTDCYVLKPQKIDVGKLLGKGGRNLNALRHIIFCLATREKRKRVVVILADDL